MPRQQHWELQRRPSRGSAVAAAAAHAGWALFEKLNLLIRRCWVWMYTACWLIMAAAYSFAIGVVCRGAPELRHLEDQIQNYIVTSLLWNLRISPILIHVRSFCPSIVRIFPFKHIVGVFNSTGVFSILPLVGRNIAVNFWTKKGSKTSRETAIYRQSRPSWTNKGDAFVDLMAVILWYFHGNSLFKHPSITVRYLMWTIGLRYIYI